MVITKEELNGLKNIGTSRLAGNFGKIKILDNGDVIKIFKDDEYVQKYHIEDELKKIRRVKVNGVALPKELVYIDDQFKGYTMPYYKGFNLSIILLKIKMGKLSITKEEMIRLYEGLIKKVKELSKHNIKLGDIKPDNIILYNNELCLVDCDSYRYTNINHLEKYNINVIDDAIKKYF